MKAFLIGAVLILVAAGTSFAQSIEIQFDPARFSTADEVREYVRRAAMGAEIEIIDLNLSSGTVELNGSAAAARHFNADPVFHRVEDRTHRTGGRSFELFLNGNQLSAERGAPAPLLPTRRTGWPGERLRVVAYSLDGRAISEAFVADPRFVRFEGWDENGEHIPGSNRSVIQDVPLPPIAVSLPAETSAIAVYDQAGTHFAPEDGQLLGHIRSDQIVEAGQ